jgi:hypothetical protein
MTFKQVKLTFVNLISGSEIGSGSDILILEIDANFPSALINYFSRILGASWLADFLIKELYVCVPTCGVVSRSYFSSQERSTG